MLADDVEVSHRSIVSLRLGRSHLSKGIGKGDIWTAFYILFMSRDSQQSLMIQRKRPFQWTKKEMVGKEAGRI